MAGNDVENAQLGAEFPDTFEKFGYEFNEEGKLINTETGEGFKFEVKENDRDYNQRHYDALGEVITEYIYELLQTKVGLEKKKVPLDPEEGGVQGFFFASPDFEKQEKLMILIHGSGVVRAGQWARRLIINDSLKSGTQLPFIERAVKEGYGVVVTNTNQNYIADDDGINQYIKGCESPEKHGVYIWRHFISLSAAKHIAIVAHSAGGGVTSALVKKFKNDFTERVFAIALTDSWLSRSYDNGKKLEDHLIEITRNWVASREPLDTPVRMGRKDIKEVSAGTTKHEETSWYAFDSIFTFFADKLDRHLNSSKQQEIENAADKSPKRKHAKEDPEISEHETQFQPANSEDANKHDKMDENWDEAIEQEKMDTNDSKETDYVEAVETDSPHTDPVATSCNTTSIENGEHRKDEVDPKNVEKHSIDSGKEEQTNHASDTDKKEL